MLSSSRKKCLNNSTMFEINPKSVYTCCYEGFDENSVSTSWKKLLIKKRFVINQKLFPLARMKD